jgi:hypothetical protein
MAIPLLIPLAAAGAQIAGSIFSFSQAKKARDKEKRAQAAAAKAMAQARKEMTVNYMKQRSIAKEPYEYEREALTLAGNTLLEAFKEGDQRGAGAGVGRVLQAQQDALAKQRAAMSQEMSQLDREVAQEEARLGTARASIDLGEATGAQAAAQDAALMAQYNTQQGIQQGIKGVTGVLTSGLFDGKKGGEETADDPFGGFIGGKAPGIGVDINTFGGYDFSGAIGNNDTIDFNRMSIFPQPQLS